MKYEKASVEVIRFENEDVVTASVCGSDIKVGYICSGYDCTYFTSTNSSGFQHGAHVCQKTKHTGMWGGGGCPFHNAR